jgi:hypothetical protein
LLLWAAARGASKKYHPSEQLSQKTEELIVMTATPGPLRQRKGEYLRKLEQDNLIIELQQISANQAQKDILRDELTGISRAASHRRRPSSSSQRQTDPNSRRPDDRVNRACPA